MLYDSEQLGGRTRSQGAMSIFGDAVFTCGLSEISAKSINFTWYNKRVGGNEILAKLDHFFHASASARRKKNWISGLFDVNGSWCSNTKELISIITDYFANLFDTCSPTSSDLDNILTHVNVSLTETMLEAPYSCEEIKFALFGMNPLQAPGPNGLPAIFFQKLWPAFGDSISDAVLKVLNGVADVSDWNNTLITLIPKVASPTEVKHFRPISLCNTVYKLVSKVIVNKMRGVLDGVVDQ